MSKVQLVKLSTDDITKLLARALPSTDVVDKTGFQQLAHYIIEGKRSQSSNEGAK